MIFLRNAASMSVFLFSLLIIPSYSAFANCLATFPKASFQKAVISARGHKEYYMAAVGKSSSSSLVIKDNHCKPLGIVKFNGAGSEFGNKLHLLFKMYNVHGLPAPLIMAVAAIPGGSDTRFVTKLITLNHKSIVQLNGINGWETQVEGGVYLGSLPHHWGTGAIVWNFLFDTNEAHAGKHRYQARIYKWDGKHFKVIKVLKTKHKYADGQTALKEFGINVKDMLVRDFSQLNRYR